MSETDKEVEERIEQIKKRAKESRFVCGKCKAITESPEIKKADSMVIVNEEYGAMRVSGDSDTLSAEELDADFPDHVEIDKEKLANNIALNWVCYVCDSEHRIFTDANITPYRIS